MAIYIPFTAFQGQGSPNSAQTKLRGNVTAISTNITKSLKFHDPDIPCINYKKKNLFVCVVNFLACDLPINSADV